MDIKKISGVLRAIGGSQRDKSYTSAIIAAAGLSRRFGGEVTKQMTELCGVPLLVHTLKAYEQADCIHEIVIVAREDEIPFWEKLCADHGISKVSRIVKGGETRQESVLNGLEATSPESRFVAIGDGARCLITPEQITEVCHAAYKYHAATAAHRATDTVKLANKRGFIESTTDRDTVWLAGTPQVFKTSLYRNFIRVPCILQVSVVEFYFQSVVVFKNDYGYLVFIPHRRRKGGKFIIRYVRFFIDLLDGLSIEINIFLDIPPSSFIHHVIIHLTIQHARRKTQRRIGKLHLIPGRPPAFDGNIFRDIHLNNGLLNKGNVRAGYGILHTVQNVKPRF